MGDLVFGGHDVIDTPLVKRAEELASAGVLPARLLPAVAPALSDADTRIRRGIDARDRKHPLDSVQRVANDLTELPGGARPRPRRRGERRVDGGVIAHAPCARRDHAPR